MTDRQPTRDLLGLGAGVAFLVVAVTYLAGGASAVRDHAGPLAAGALVLLGVAGLVGALLGRRRDRAH